MAQSVPGFLRIYHRSVSVIRSWISLIFPNMESNLACRSLHLLDRVVLSHVSARAWHIVSSPLSIVHYGAAGVFVNTTVPMAWLYYHRWGKTPAPIGHCKFIVLSTPLCWLRGDPSPVGRGRTGIFSSLAVGSVARVATFSAGTRGSVAGIPRLRLTEVRPLFLIPNV